MRYGKFGSSIKEKEEEIMQNLALSNEDHCIISHILSSDIYCGHTVERCMDVPWFIEQIPCSKKLRLVFEVLSQYII